MSIAGNSVYPAVVALHGACARGSGRWPRSARDGDYNQGQGQLEGFCLNARLGLYPESHRELQVSQGRASP